MLDRVCPSSLLLITEIDKFNDDYNTHTCITHKYMYIDNN